MKRKISKVVSGILTVTLLVSVFVTPVAAGQENGRERRNVPIPEIQYLDAEVQVIAGQPVIVVENEEGYVHVPFALSGDVLVQGNGVVVQTEDGSVVVPLEEFEVVGANGQAMLVAEVNALIVVPILVGALGGAGTMAGILATAKTFGAITTLSKTAFWTTIGTGAAIGGAGGWYHATR